MIGKICKAKVPFYDVKTNTTKEKGRPVLVIGGPRNNDYTVLPVSTVTRRQNLDRVYDKEIDPTIYPNSGLNKTSYVRTHKQTTVHQSHLGAVIGDLKTDYESLYLEIMELLEQFNKEVLNDAL